MHTPKGRVLGWAVALALASSVSALAQNPPPPIEGKSTTVSDLTPTNTLGTAVKAVNGPAHGGDALALATQLAVGTAPFGISSGGFLMKLDPSTGVTVRAATTFGPSFAERALTSGEGSISVGATLSSAEYSRLGDEDFDGLLLRSSTGGPTSANRNALSHLTITANTVVVSARMGVTDNLDIGVDLPIVSVKLGGATELQNGGGQVLTYASAASAGTGLGDASGIVKYRLRSFGEGLPDPGGVAVMGTIRLPTGSRDSLRGLGVTRAGAMLIVSSGRQKFRPHVNVGFEFWSDDVGVTSDAGGFVSARNQFMYDAGFEYEAAAKCTLLVDALGGQILGGGKVDVVDDAAPAGGTASRSLVALSEGIRRFQIAPGAKVNLKGKLLLSANVLITLSDGGLYDRVVPFAGLEMSF